MYEVIHGDSQLEISLMPDNSIDAIVTDPPYGLGKEPDPVKMLAAWLDHGYLEVKGKGFMGKEWDSFVPQPLFWKEAFRVLKPGGHVLSFFGTRTYDWGVMAIRLAGFEIRDQLAWVYGCLSEDSEVLTERGFMTIDRIRKTKNIRILAYDPTHDTYAFEKPSRWSEYRVEDTCYRIQSDSTDQLVSRNHRCLIEREGGLLFELAETVAQKHEARVPVLESLSMLPGCFLGTNEGAGGTEQNLLSDLQKQIDREGKRGENEGGKEGERGSLRILRKSGLEAGGVVKTDKNTDLLAQVQRGIAGPGLESARLQRAESLETGIGESPERENDGRYEPRVERRDNLPQKKGLLRGGKAEIGKMPSSLYSDGKGGPLRSGISAAGGGAAESSAASLGGSAPHRPQSDEQRAEQSDAVCVESGPQTTRSRKSYKTTLATITPVKYSGIIFCPTVSTGAFVARRNGKIFLTGNSGFPKSLDISKAIDKAAGAEREVVGVKQNSFGRQKGGGAGWAEGITGEVIKQHDFSVTAPATDAAKQWSGWGTALKPAWEPICLARKPLIGTVAENVLEHGTGGLNIDGCRVESDEITGWKGGGGGLSGWIEGGGLNAGDARPVSGRFPANLIHDGSDEVVALFPDTKRGKTKQSIEGGEFNVYGKQYPREVETIDDSGSAARFFYCAKASKADRDAACEIYSYLKYETGLCKEENTELAALLQKDTYDSMVKWFTDESGKSILALFQTDSKSTIKTEIKRIIALTISSLSILLPTSEYTEDAALLMTNGISPAESAELPTQLKTGTIKEKMVFLRGAKNAVLKMQSETNDAESYLLKNWHSTVKPTALMRYLCRLITPPGGTVLDPFAGSGSTGRGAVLEGFDCILIEQGAEYIPIIEARVADAAAKYVDPLEL